MTTATEQLIDLATSLDATGEIGDGMVARFHRLAEYARAEGPSAQRSAATKRVRAVADGATINETYGMGPGESIALFRMDLKMLCPIAHD